MYILREDYSVPENIQKDIRYNLRPYLSMIRFQEERHLCKLVGYADGAADKAAWLFVIDDWQRKTQVSLRDKSIEDVAKLFMKAKVKDNAKQPRSIRGTTYRQMVEEIYSGADRISWIWSNQVGLFYDAAKQMKLGY